MEIEAGAFGRARGACEQIGGSYLSSRRRQRIAVLVQLVLLLAGCFSSACSKPKVTGHVLLPFQQGKFRPAGNVEVLLVKGDLEAVFRNMAEQYDAQAVAEAANSTLGILKTRLAKREAELASIPSLSEDGNGKRASCAATAAKAEAEARERYARLFEQLMPKMKKLGIAANDVEQARQELQARLSAGLAEAARNLAVQYLRTQVSVDSGVVLSAGLHKPDRLCWRITNSGGLKLIAVDVHVTHDGRRLPPAVLKQYWSTPFELDNVVLRIRNRYGQEVRGLPPGSSFTECFYALAPKFTAEQRQSMEASGLPTGSASRIGAWGIEIDDGILTDGDAVTVKPPGSPVAHVEYPRRDLVDVMAPQLRALREQSPYGELVSALTDSEEARALKAAEKAHATCLREDTLEKQVEELRQAVRALENGKTKDAAARKAITELVRELKGNPEKRSALVARCEQKIETGLFTFQDSAVDGAFEFTEVPQGEYTLVATNKTKLGSFVTWIVPIRVDGDVRQELGKANVQEGTLQEVLDRIITGLPPPRADGKPAAAPRTKAQGHE